MALYMLVHRVGGPVATYRTEAEARGALEAVLRDEPGWADELSIEPFEFTIARAEERET